MTTTVQVVESDDQIDAETRSAIARIRAAAQFASIACGGDRAAMISTLLGAVVLIARSTTVTDELLAESQESLGMVRARLAANAEADARAS